MSSDESSDESCDWIRLEDLECAEAWIEADESVQWRTNRLFDPNVPFSTGLETDRAMGVFVNVEPGHACERHTHDVEEVILVHRGTLEFTVGDTVTTQVAGELSVVPPNVPHAFRNVGDTTAGVLGILPTKEAKTTFERVVRPIGARTMGPTARFRKTMKMRSESEVGSVESARWLRRWMIGVGVIYLLLAVNLSSLLVAPERVYQFFPPFDAALDSVAFAVVADLAFLFALSHGVIGAYLLWGSRRPTEYAVLVPLLIALELVVGIVDDLYSIFLRDYPVDAVYYGFIVLHVVIIITGYLLYPRGN